MSGYFIVFDLADSGERIEKEPINDIYYFYDRDNNLIFKGFCYCRNHKLMLGNGTVYYPDLGTEYIELRNFMPSTSIDELVGFEDSEDLITMLYRRIMSAKHTHANVYDRIGHLVFTKEIEY